MCRQDGSERCEGEMVQHIFAPAATARYINPLYIYDYRSSNLQRLLANAELVHWNSIKTSEEDAN